MQGQYQSYVSVINVQNSNANRRGFLERNPYIYTTLSIGVDGLYCDDSWVYVAIFFSKFHLKKACKPVLIWLIGRYAPGFVLTSLTVLTI